MTRYLTFFGPEHHLKLLCPIVEALAAQGFDNTWYTANADATFEQVGQEMLGDFRFLPAELLNADGAQKLYQRYLAKVQPHYLHADPCSLVIPDVMDRCLYEIARDQHALKTLFAKVEPSFALALHELHRWGKNLGYRCAVRKIPFVTLQEGMYYAPPIFYRTHCKYSESFVWGEATKHVLVDAGNDPDRVHVIGHPSLARRWREAYSRRIDARKSLPDEWHGKELGVLYLTAHGLSHELKWDILAKQGSIIVHPAITEERPKIAKLKERLREFPTIHVEEDPTLLWPHTAIAEAVLVAGCSTFSLECLWKGKPLMEIPLPYQPFSFAQHGLCADGSSDSDTPWMDAAKEFLSHDSNCARIRDFTLSHIANPDAAALIAAEIAQRV